MRLNFKKLMALGLIISAIALTVTGIYVAKGGMRKINSQVPLVVSGYEDRKSAEEDLLKLTQLSLLETDNNGNIVLNGKNADVGVKYNSSTDTTKITIKLDGGLKFNDGKELTAEDVIFTYYWLINEKENRGTAVASLPFSGLDEYLYNSSKASSLMEATRSELSNPSEETKKLIADNVIAPFLKSQFEWVKSLYGKDEYKSMISGFDQPKDFFANIYAPKDKYNSKNHDEASVLAEVISEYGYDYGTLGYAYSGDNEYFTKEAMKQAFAHVSASVEKQEAVSGISGISKDGASTVVLSLKGYDASYVYDVCNIYVLPKHRYSSVDEVGVNIDCTTGAGMYTITEQNDNEIKLSANKYYNGEEPLNTYVTLKLNQGESTEEGYSLTYDTSSYCYLGFNVNNVNVKGDPLSSESCELRKNISAAFHGESVKAGAGNNRYTVYICAGGNANHPAMQYIETAKKKLSEAGITLDVTDVKDPEQMWDAVKNGKAQMWVAVWNDAGFSDFRQKYASASMNTSDSSKNPYKLSNNELDSMISDYYACRDNDKLTDKASKIKNKIDSFAVESVLYTKTKNLVLSPVPKNSETVFKKTGKNNSWINEIGNIKLTD